MLHFSKAHLLFGCDASIGITAEGRWLTHRAHFKEFNEFPNLRDQRADNETPNYYQHRELHMGEHKEEGSLLESSKSQGLEEKSHWCPVGIPRQHKSESGRQLRTSIGIPEVSL